MICDRNCVRQHGEGSSVVTLHHITQLSGTRTDGKAAATALHGLLRRLRCCWGRRCWSADGHWGVIVAVVIVVVVVVVAKRK
jgi:hypothetical protein